MVCRRRLGRSPRPRLSHRTVRDDLACPSGAELPETHRWIVAPLRHRASLVVEAALQRFAAAWGDRAPARAHPLWLGRHDPAELEQPVR